MRLTVWGQVPNRPTEPRNSYATWGCCGTKAIEQAKALGETVAREYPYSPAVDETKKAIVEAVVAQQSQ